LRIRVVQKLSITSIDGIHLQGFEPGQSYDVGATVGALLLAEGWAEPDDGSPVTAVDAPAPVTTKILRVSKSVARGIAADSARRT
jgi:hypothetical protein